jgi:hypothetical protein
MNGIEGEVPGLAAYERSVRIVRDIVFFFQEQAEYSFVMSDLDYTWYIEKYWEALVEDDEMPGEIQRGCLALLFAMGEYEAGCVGIALGDDLSPCLAGLRRFAPPDDETKRLKELALQALALAATPIDRRDWDAVNNLALEHAWIYDAAVRPYFRSRAERA